MNQILAPIIDKFKAQNPTLFILIQLILGAILYVINNGVDLGAFELSPLIDQLGTWINYVLIALIGAQGSRTKRYVQPVKENIPGSSGQ